MGVVWAVIGVIFVMGYDFPLPFVPVYPHPAPLPLRERGDSSASLGMTETCSHFDYWVY